MIAARIRSHWPLGLLLIATLLIRLVIPRDLWLDEIESLLQAGAPTFRETLRLMPIDHPPLYHFLLHNWMLLQGGGESAWGIRSMSVLFGVGGIAAIYLLANHLFGRTYAIVAAAILALSPFHIWYSQEARMYSQLFFFSTLSLYFFFRLLKKDNLWLWTGFVLTTAAVVYTHYTGLLLFGLEAVMGVYFARKYARAEQSDSAAPGNPGAEGGSDRPPPGPGRWLVAAGTTFVLLLPLVFLFLWKNQTSPLAPLEIPQAFTAVMMGAVSEMFVGFHSRAAVARLGAFWPILLYLGPIAVLGYRYMFEDKTRILVVVFLASVACIGLAGYFRPQVFSPRFLTVGFPAMVLLLAWLFVGRNGRPRYLWLSVFLMVLAVAAADQALDRKNHMRFENRAPLGFVAQAARTNDAVLFSPPYMDRIFNYFYPPAGIEPFGVPEFANFAQGTFTGLDRQLQALTEGRDRVFLVYSFDELDPRVAPSLRRIDAYFRDKFPLAETYRYNNVTVTCYTDDDPCPVRKGGG